MLPGHLVGLETHRRRPSLAGLPNQKLSGMYMAGARALPTVGEQNIPILGLGKCYIPLKWLGFLNNFMFPFRVFVSSVLSLASEKCTCQTSTLWSAVPQQSVGGYHPVIPSSPRELSTVRELPNHSTSRMHSQHWTRQFITNPGNSVEASRQVWTCCSAKGCFPYSQHIDCCLGKKRFTVESVGELLVESGIVASGPVNAVLAGHR